MKPPRPCLGPPGPPRERCANYALPNKERCAKHHVPRAATPSGRVVSTRRWRTLRAEMIAAAPRPVVCGICGYVIHDETLIEVDHIVPVAAGGDPYDPANLRLAHRKCNRRKGAVQHRKPTPAQVRQWAHRAV